MEVYENQESTAVIIIVTILDCQTSESPRYGKKQRLPLHLPTQILKGNDKDEADVSSTVINDPHIQPGLGRDP
jgi:hypothetical protein